MGFLSDKITVLSNGRELLNMPNSVNFGIITKDNYIILGEQFRASTQTVSQNLFGGYIDKGESEKEAIIRELFEETNINKDCIESIEYLYKSKLVSMGYTSEKNTLALIRLNKCSFELDLKCNDDDENITIVSLQITKELLCNLISESLGLKSFLLYNHLLNKLNQNHNFSIVAFCSKSGAGKSTLINNIYELDKDKYHVVKSFTTRSVRVEDPNDINTHTFVSESFLEENRDKVISLYNSPKGYYNFVSMDSFENNKVNLFAIDTVAVENELAPYCKKHNIPLKVVYLDLSDEIRKERYEKREGGLEGFDVEKHLGKEHLKTTPYIKIDVSKDTMTVLKQTLISLGEM